MVEFLGWGFSFQDLFTGVVTGLTYAALGAGFVLIYRATGVLNFAHAEVGAFSVALFALMVLNFNLNWWFAFVLTILAGALVSGTIEITIIRRFSNASRLVLLIATIGVAQLLLLARLSLPAVSEPGPIPLPFVEQWALAGQVRILGRDLLVLILVPALVLLLALLMHGTRAGLAIRAAAENPDTAKLFGISVRRSSTAIWAIAGALAAATAVLFVPLSGISASQTSTAALGAPLLLRALMVGLLARMRSLPLTLISGVAVGIFEKIIRSNVDSTNRSVVDLYLFLAVLVVVLFGIRQRRLEFADWSLTSKIRPIPRRLANSWAIRNLQGIGLWVLFGALALLGWGLESPSALWLWSGILLFTMAALSITLLTGWAGQISLGQFAFVGLGAFTAVALTSGHDLIPFGMTYIGLDLPWGLAVLVSTVFGALAALLIGLPALRARGLYLAVITLAFAVAASSWIFPQKVFSGGTTAVRPVNEPVIGPFDFGESRKSFYFLCLGFLAAVTIVVARLRRTGIGRSMIAMRENEELAAASTVSPGRMKIVAFASAGAIAALAGTLYATLQANLSPSNTFRPEFSIDVVAISVIGGMGTVAGPFLGSLWVKGLPALVDTTAPPLTVQLATSGAGLLLLLLYFPGGFSQIVYNARDGLLRALERRREARSGSAPGDGVAGDAAPVDGVAGAFDGDAHPRFVEAPSYEVSGLEPPGSAAREDYMGGAVWRSGVVFPEDAGYRIPQAGELWLSTQNVSVRFGGNLAVDGVDFDVRRGELVGLIGTNGAGKSSFLNAIGGFLPHTGEVEVSGSIEVLGRKVSGLSAHRRHRLGLGRSFQSPRLFPDLTVSETIMVALEARERSMLVSSFLALPSSLRAEGRKRAATAELVDYFGLGRFADHFVSELSTGTRRIVALACLLANDARVLLMDEPAGGLSQPETEAFALLIKRLQDEMDATIVMIEHDMTLVMGISDRVYCLEAGSVIAKGTPATLRENPRVLASYLGGGLD